MSSERQTGTVKSVAVGNVVVGWAGASDVVFRVADFAAAGLSVPPIGHSIGFFAEPGNALSASLTPGSPGGGGGGGGGDAGIT